MIDLHEKSRVSTNLAESHHRAGGRSPARLGRSPARLGRSPARGDHYIVLDLKKIPLSANWRDDDFPLSW